MATSPRPDPSAAVSRSAEDGDAPAAAPGAPEVLDAPGQASAEQGFVVLDGPQGLAATMTPDAARATAQSLSTAADAADTQRREPPAP